MWELSSAPSRERAMRRKSLVFMVSVFAELMTGNYDAVRWRTFFVRRSLRTLLGENSDLDDACGSDRIVDCGYVGKSRIAVGAKINLLFCAVFDGRADLVGQVGVDYRGRSEESLTIPRNRQLDVPFAKSSALVGGVVAWRQVDGKSVIAVLHGVGTNDADLKQHEKVMGSVHCRAQWIEALVTAADARIYFSVGHGLVLEQTRVAGLRLDH